jgi:hypothetical protein
MSLPLNVQNVEHIKKQLAAHEAKKKFTEELVNQAKLILENVKSAGELRLAILRMFKEGFEKHPAEMMNPITADQFFLACLEVHHICLQNVFVSFDKKDKEDKEDKEGKKDKENKDNDNASSNTDATTESNSKSVTKE